MNTAAAGGAAPPAAEPGVKVDLVERTLQALLEQVGKPVVILDQAAGKEETFSPAMAAARDGLLPVFLVAGEAVWREATGRDFGLEIVPDREALLGHRVARIGGGSFSTVMLSVLEATDQATGPEAVLVNELGALWQDATQRIAERHRSDRQVELPLPRVATSAGPGPS
jgi:hypothetical protein